LAYCTRLLLLAISLMVKHCWQGDSQRCSGSIDQEHDADGHRTPSCIVYEPSVRSKGKPSFWEDTHAARDEGNISIDEALDETLESTAAGSISPTDSEQLTVDSSPLSHRSAFEHAWCLVNQRKHEEEMVRLQQQLNERMEECIRLRQQSRLRLQSHASWKPQETLGFPFGGRGSPGSPLKLRDRVQDIEGEPELPSFSRLCGIEETPFASDCHENAAPGVSGDSTACSASFTDGGDSELFTDRKLQATDGEFGKVPPLEVGLTASNEPQTARRIPLPDECGQDQQPNQVLRWVSAPYRVDVTPQQHGSRNSPGMRPNYDMQQQQQQRQQHQQHRQNQSHAMSPPRRSRPFPGRCQSVTAKSLSVLGSRQEGLCLQRPAQRPEIQQPRLPPAAPHPVRLGQHPQTLLQMLPLLPGPGMQQPRR